MLRQSIFIIILLFVWGQTATAQLAPPCTWAVTDTLLSLPYNNNYQKNIVSANTKKLLWARIRKYRYIDGSNLYGDQAVTEYTNSDTALKTIIIEGSINPESILTDASGNWYLTGRFRDTLRFPGETPVVRHLLSITPDKFICRLAAGTLHLDWLKLIGNRKQWVGTWHMGMLNGKIYTWADSAAEKTTIYAVDMNNGNISEFVTQVRAGIISSIQADSSGNLYVAGGCAEKTNTTFGNHTENFGVNNLRYIVRYKANGDFDWVVTTSDKYCTGRQLTIANNNLLYYSGALSDSTSLGGHQLSWQYKHSWGYILAALDSSGNVHWALQTPDSAGGSALLRNAIHTVVADSGIYLVTGVKTPMDWGNGVNTGQLQFNAPQVAVVKYDLNGIARWVNFTESDESLANCIATNNYDLWFTGVAKHDHTFKMNNITGPVKYQFYTPFLAKMQLKPYPLDTPNAVTITNRTDFTLYPNPATHTLTIRTGNNLQGPLHLQLVNATGVAVYSRDIDAGKQDIVLDVAAYPRGVYFAELKHAEGTIMRKVLLQ